MVVAGPGFSGVSCVESDARRWIVRRCPTCGGGSGPPLSFGHFPLLLRSYLGGGNPASQTALLDSRLRGKDGGLRGVNPRTPVIPCVRFASLPRPFVVCLGFAKGTGDHEGRPYGLNWQPSTKWSKKLGLVTPMAISCWVFRGG